MSVIIRPYTPADYDWVLQCEVDLQEHERAIHDTPWPMETRDSTRYGYVSDIFIKPEARGAGLAQALLDAIAAHLYAADPTLTRLRVNVLAVNAIARRSYEKAG